MYKINTVRESQQFFLNFEPSSLSIANRTAKFPASFLIRCITHACGSRCIGTVISSVSDFACLCLPVRTLKEKRLGLSTPLHTWKTYSPWQPLVALRKRDQQEGLAVASIVRDVYYINFTRLSNTGRYDCLSF